jgi:hypothetical protein
MSRQRLCGLLILAAIPSVLFVACPFLDSPFLAAKCSVVLVFGVFASLLLFLAPAASFTLPKPTGRRFFTMRRIALICLGCWVFATGFAVLHGREWQTSWRPILLYGSSACIVATLSALRVKRLTLLSCIAVSSIVLALVVLSGYAGFDLPRLFSGAPAPGRMRTSATLGNPLFVASFLSASIWSICESPRLPTRWRVCLLFIVVCAIAATGERTAIISLFAGAVCWLASSGRPIRSVRLKAVLAILAMSILLISTHALNPRSFESAASGRILLWKTSLHHLDPLGTGPGSFYWRYAQNLRDVAPAFSAPNLHYAGYETQAHNLAVQQIVESGPTAAVAFFALIALWFVRNWKISHQPGIRSALAGTVAFLAASCFDNPLSRPEGVLLLASLMIAPFLSAGDQFLNISSFVSFGWPRRLLPLCSVIFLAAAVANAACSYAIYSAERAEQLAQLPQSERWLRLALTIDSGSQDAHFDLVRVLCETGDYRSCWSESENALRWVDEAELHLLRVRVLEAMGRNQMAQRELDLSRHYFPWSRELRAEQVPSTTTPSTAY